jgi:hypothetical protein
MMEFTNLCRLKNVFAPKTWKNVNEALARYADLNESIVRSKNDYFFSTFLS